MVNILIQGVLGALVGFAYPGPLDIKLVVILFCVAAAYINGMLSE